jgi:hypothetical protein
LLNDFSEMKKLLLSLFLIVSITATAADIYVSPVGNDASSGDSAHPLATLSSAIRMAREMRRLCSEGAKDGITIHLMSGVHRLYEPVVVRTEDSGTTDSPTIIRGEDGAVLSGGVRICGWKRQGKLWVARVPDFNGRPLDFRQLWINGRKAVRARDVSDFEQMNRIRWVDKKNQTIWVPASSVKKIITAPYPEMVLHEMWCVANLRIKSITLRGDSAGLTFHNPESRLQFEHPWPSPMYNCEHNSPFYLTNAIELTDTEGEWYHDIRTGLLYYYPRKDENMSTADAEVPAIETLVKVTGTAENGVHDVTFDNIRFSYTTWMRPSYYGSVPLQAGMFLTEAYRLRPKMERSNGDHKLDNQGWTGRADAAVEVSCGSNINFHGCRFEHIGGSGLDYIVGDDGGTTDDCIFSDISLNGYVAGSFASEGLESHIAYNPSDSSEVCRHQTLRNCMLKDIANDDWGCVAVCAGYVSDINIEHNEIHDVSYTGISLGWGWTCSPNCMKNNIVHANRIYRYAMHMYDTAGIYTLSMQPNSSVTENAVYGICHPSYVHDPNHWFYLYTDEGSSFITVKDNYTESEKYLKNANGPGCVWTNNGPQVADSIKKDAGLLNINKNAITE